MSAIGQRTAGPGKRSRAKRKARSAEQSRSFELLVRAGFGARGITYAVVGALALALALGAGTLGASASQQGALALIARDWVGELALIVIAAGLLGYALWKLIQGIFGRGPEGGGGTDLIDRAGNIGGGIAYLLFFAIAIRTLTGSGGSSSGNPGHTAAGILGWPGGPELVAVGGLALVGISAYQIYDAVTGHFAHEAKTEDMNQHEQRLFQVMGRMGLTARALVFVLIGYFLIRTALEFNPKAAVGVDGALSRLHHQPMGPWLVGLVAVGLLVFAAFSFFEGRYRRL